MHTPMPSPSFLRPSLPPGAAHLAAAKRYSERHIAKGLCEKCPEPLAHHSVRYCEKHLAMKREQDRCENHRRGKRGNPNLEPGTREYLYGAEEVPLSTHGRQPGTLPSLAMHGAISREKKTRALLAELGIKPEHAAVSLNAAKEALLEHMPDKAHAMTQTELFEKAGVITRTTGEKALKALLAENKIQRIGAGGVREPYRYFLKG